MNYNNNFSIKGNYKYYNILFYILMFFSFILAGILSVNYFYYIGYGTGTVKYDLICGAKGSIFDCRGIYSDPGFVSDILSWIFNKLGCMTDRLLFPISFGAINFYISLVLFNILGAFLIGTSLIYYYAVLVILSVVNIIDIILFFKMVFSHPGICLYCILSYIVNLLLLCLVYYNFFRRYSVSNLFNIFDITSVPRQIIVYLRDNKSNFLYFLILYIFNKLFVLLTLLFICVSLTYNFKYFHSNNKAEAYLGYLEYFKDIQNMNYFDKDKEINTNSITDSINSAGNVLIGNKDAKVQLVVIHDFVCGSCRNKFPWMTQLTKQYNGDLLSIRYIHYPIHENEKRWFFNSKVLTKYALFAHEKGIYIKFSNLLVSYINKIISDMQSSRVEPNIDEKKEIVNLFQAAGLDLSYDQINQGASKQIKNVEKDEKIAVNFFKSNNMQGVTPTIFINGKLLSKGVNSMVLKALINSLIIDDFKNKN